MYSRRYRSKYQATDDKTGRFTKLCIHWTTLLGKTPAKDGDPGLLDPAEAVWGDQEIKLGLKANITAIILPLSQSSQTTLIEYISITTFATISYKLDTVSQSGTSHYFVWLNASFFCVHRTRHDENKIVEKKERVRDVGVQVFVETRHS